MTSNLNALSQSSVLNVLPKSNKTNGVIKGRISARVDFRIVFVVAFIALLFFGALFGIVVGSPALGNRSISSTTLVKFNNATCSRLPQFNTIIQQKYIEWGDFNIEPNSHEIEANVLVRRLPKADFLEQRHIQKKIYDKLYRAAQDYLKIADQSDHPADQVLALHKARVLLKQADETIYFKIEDLESKIDKILCCEAKTCAMAAKLAVGSKAKLSWIFRGIRELNQGIKELNLDRQANPCLFRECKEKCKVAFSLWDYAGEVFLSHPEGKMELELPINLELVSSTNLEAAAVSYANAGKLLYHLRDDSSAVSLFAKALQIYKEINLTSFTLLQQAKLQEEVLDLSYQMWNLKRMDLKQLFTECLTTQRLYGELAQLSKTTNTHFVILQATYLRQAAYFAPSIEKSLDLYKTGKEILENLWISHQFECEHHRGFTLESLNSIRRSRSWNLEDSLLGYFRKMVAESEKLNADKNSIFNNLFNLFA